MEALPWPTITAETGGWVLFGIAAVALIFGLLVPRKAVNDMIANHNRALDDVIHDRDEWRAEARLKDQQVAELGEQNTILLREIGPGMKDFMEALQRAGKREPS